MAHELSRVRRFERSDQSPGDDFGADWPVDRRRALHQRRQRARHRRRITFAGPALAPRAEQKARACDLDQIEARAAYGGFRLALDAQVEIARVRLRADRRDKAETFRAAGRAKTGESGDIIAVDARESVLRSGDADGRAERAQAGGRREGGDGGARLIERAEIADERFQPRVGGRRTASARERPVTGSKPESPGAMAGKGTPAAFVPSYIFNKSPAATLN